MNRFRVAQSRSSPYLLVNSNRFASGLELFLHTVSRLCGYVSKCNNIIWLVPYWVRGQSLYHLWFDQVLLKYSFFIYHYEIVGSEVKMIIFYSFDFWKCSIFVIFLYLSNIEKVVCHFIQNREEGNKDLFYFSKLRFLRMSTSTRLYANDFIYANDLRNLHA